MVKEETAKKREPWEVERDARELAIDRLRNAEGKKIKFRNGEYCVQGSRGYSYTISEVHIERYQDSDKRELCHRLKIYKDDACLMETTERDYYAKKIKSIYKEVKELYNNRQASLEAGKKSRKARREAKAKERKNEKRAIELEALLGIEKL